MTRIYDAFMLNDELDLLECRLSELEGSVYRHILVEATADHHGRPKPLHYLENQERFAPWADRIIHVMANALPDDPDPWVREHAQRDAALPALADADGGDVVLICDVDEFPPPAFLNPDPAARVRQRLEPDQAVVFRQRMCMYAADWEYPGLQLCAVAARVGHARERGLAAVRDTRGRYPQVTGGWHLTWLGGVEAHRAKLGVHCHTEMTAQQAAWVAAGHCYTKGIHYGGWVKLTPVDVDETWPWWIHERKCPPSWFRPRDTRPA